MADKKFNLKDSLNKLSEIVAWFERQEEVDVEAGLEKVKEGAKLVKDCKARLSEIENEFQEIQKEVDKEIATKAPKKLPSSEDNIGAEDLPF